MINTRYSKTITAAQQNRVNYFVRKIMTENELSFAARGAIFDVYNELGPGLLESTYRESLAYNLRQSGLFVEKEVGVPVFYKGVSMGIGYRIDIKVEHKLIIEVKSVEELCPVHYKQLQTYLKLSGLKLGLLVNFNTEKISKSIHRRVNNL